MHWKGLNCLIEFKSEVIARRLFCGYRVHKMQQCHYYDQGSHNHTTCIFMLKFSRLSLNVEDFAYGHFYLTLKCINLYIYKCMRVVNMFLIHLSFSLSAHEAS